MVALSGGVDSSVAAALLVEQGYQVIGVMLRLWSEEEGLYHNRCCTPADADLARRVADVLGIPFYRLDVAESFKAHVVDSFIADYLAGRTPNPCIRCNRLIRFGWLLDKALSLGADQLATRHYARRRTQESTHATPYQLLRGLDPAKDQSYVLSMLTQTQLSHVVFPLGEWTKGQVRELAERKGLPVAHKPDSQDLCFVAGGDYRRFLRRYAPPGAIRPGPIRDTGGRVLGQHEGLPFYTIGQRKELKLNRPEPMYVLALVPTENALIVGPASELGREECHVQQVHYVSGQVPGRPFRASVQIRYRAREVEATVTPLSHDRAHIQFVHPLRDITPGQGAVFYEGESVIGGGIIEPFVIDV